MKRLLSIFLLLSLLLAWTERDIHELGHLNDETCNDATLHFCQAEHHCHICDASYSGGLFVEAQASQEDLQIFEYSYRSFLPLAPERFYTEAITLRGPPVI